MSQRAKIQRKRERAAALSPVQSDAAQDSPFALQQDMDEAPSIVEEVHSSPDQSPGHDFSRVRIHAGERTGANESMADRERTQPVARLEDASVREKVIGPEGGPLSSNLAASIQAERGSGDPLNAPVREQMEQAFGANFADVRLHSDSASHEFNHSVGARAFTVGSDIFLGPRTSPDETGMLAHELTHVVQQRNMDDSGPMVVGPAGDSYEQEADMTSATVAAPMSPGVEDTTDGAHQVQRISDDIPLNREASAAHTATGASRSGTGLVIQREGPAIEERVANLEKHQQVQDIHQKATDLDLQWQAKFDKQFSNYHETIDRISAGLQAATTGFQEAQKKQAETDAMVWQVIGIMLTLAGGFEWAFAPKLGELAGVTDKTAEHILSVAHAGADVVADVGKEGAGKPGEKPETPAIPGAQTPAGAAGGDPLAFMTSNSAALEHQRQTILDAFIQRSNTTRNFSDDDWSNFNLADQEQKYQQLYDELQKVASDADKLKSDKDIAFVLERHLWARWISGQAEEMAKEYKEMQEAYAMAPMGGMTAMPDEKDAEQNYSLGGDIEDRLNEVKMAEKAGVTLTGHWYSSNSPDNWREVLLNYARGYNEGINA